MPERKPVLHIDYLYDMPLPVPLAAAIQILNTCHALARAGASVRLLTNRLQASQAAILREYGLAPHPNFDIVQLFGTPDDTPQSIVRAVQRDGMGDQPQVIMSRGESGLRVFQALRKAEKRQTQIYLYEAHRFVYTEAKWWRRWRKYHLERAVLDIVDGVVCLTEGVRVALDHEFGLHQPVLILPSGVHVPVQPPPSDAHRDIDILYAGKLIKRKGIEDLIQAMTYLPEHSLMMVGGSPAQVAELEKQAQHLRIDLTLTGYVAPSQVIDYYQRARVGVCPLPTGTSLIAEQFTSPLKVLQMMANGVPIVGTDVPSLHNILVQDETALLVAPGQPRALADALNTLIADRSLANRLAQAARQQVQPYSWENRASSLLMFIEQLQNGATPPQ